MKLFLITLTVGFCAHAADFVPIKARTIKAMNQTAEKTTIQVSVLSEGSTGKSLYTFDRDTAGVSNCTGGCETTWPPLLATKEDTTKLVAPLSAIERADKSLQIAYGGRPLYTYSSDEQAGEIHGDGVGKIWHLAVTAEVLPK